MFWVAWLFCQRPATFCESLLFASVKKINKTRGCEASFLVAFDPKDYERAQRARMFVLELIFRVNRGGGVGLTNLSQILRNKKK